MSIIRVLSPSILALSLAVGATGANALSLASMLHVHPHVSTQDQRVSVQVTNPNREFRDVKIGDREYTLQPHASLLIKAPAGTPIFAADNMSRTHRKGSLLAEVNEQVKTISLD